MAPQNIMSIWAQMDYIPPRGPCNNGKSMLNSGCSCQRFMAHPLKMASSFECDGCGHHASFHKMDNPSEDAVLKRWEAEEKERREMQEDTNGRKRPRQAIENGEGGSSPVLQISATSTTTAKRTLRKATGARKARQTSHSNSEVDDGDRIYEILSDA